MARVLLVGGPTSYRAALTTRLNAIGQTPVHSESARDIDVAIIYFPRSPDPGLLARTVGRHGAVVAVLSSLDLDDYRLALAAGSGAVHIDMSAEIVVDVALAAINGEALLPMSVAQMLAAPSSTPPHDGFTEVDRAVAARLLDGVTLATIAAELNYSERTIRRRVQGIYLRLGVRTRAEALDALRRR